MRAKIFFRCFLGMAGSAWAQVEEDTWRPASQLHTKSPGYYYGQPRVSSTPESLQGFDAWYQQQREQHR